MASNDTGWVEFFCPLRAVHFADIQIDTGCRLSYKSPNISLPCLSIISGECIVESWDSNTCILCIRLSKEEEYKILQSLEWRIESLALGNYPHFEGIYVPIVGNGCVTFHVKNPWVWRNDSWSQRLELEKGQTIRWAVRFTCVQYDYTLTLDHQVVAIICMKS
jgi:hypothetical protein